MKLRLPSLKTSLLKLVLINSLVFAYILPGLAQNIPVEIKGKVTDESGAKITGATVRLNNPVQMITTDSGGLYRFVNLKPGNYIIKVSMKGFDKQERRIKITSGKNQDISFILKNTSNQLNEVVIKGYKTIKGMGYLNDVHDGVIYSGKKTEVILLDSLNANTAQNNPRQILGRIPGANYSETEGSGFPSNGIGFRGLNPTQSIETNTRQNGYNVAADIFGYPETYYLPPLEAVERIEVTRGAASLQFGPQFGGVINYIIKKGPADKPLEINIQQTGGSFSLYNSFVSAGGQLGKWNYYSFIQYKAIQGWMPNSNVQQVSGFAGVNYQANDKLKLGLEYSILRNRIHMPGGLDDEKFKLNSRASYRARNWLNSPWNILTGKLDYQFSPATKLSVKSAYQFSSRNLVWKNEDGGPGTPDSISPVTLQPVNREVQREIFHANTTEARLTSDYGTGEMKNTLAAGIRLSYGKMKREGGGLGSTGSDFDLTLLNPRYGYNLNFTTTNIAPFVENIFRFGKRLSVTPGFRYEYLKSTIDGYADSTQTTHGSKDRFFALFGVGAQYVTTPSTNIYANISQAYSPVTYDQLTPFGSATKIDPNLKDAKGYNADLGWRGSVKNYLNFDVSGFYLRYNNRIGITQKFDASGNPYSFRTNIANSVHRGAETYIEFNITKALFPGSTIGEFSFYNSFSYIDARYVSGDYKGKFVEYAPQTINRFGATYTYKGFSTTFLVSNTAKSFGDANNTVLGNNSDPSAGLIPAYHVLDWSSALYLGKYNFKFGVNNLADARYFTLRTDEYPGPGIIPAIGRSFYIGFGAKF